MYISPYVEILFITSNDGLSKYLSAFININTTFARHHNYLTDNLSDKYIKEKR